MSCSHKRGKELSNEIRVANRASLKCNCCLQPCPTRLQIWGCRLCHQKFCSACYRERFWKDRPQIVKGAFVTMNLEATAQVCGSKPAAERCTGQVQSLSSDRRTAWVDVGLNTLHRIAVCWLAFERQGQLETEPTCDRFRRPCSGVVDGSARVPAIVIRTLSGRSFVLGNLNVLSRPCLPVLTYGQSFHAFQRLCLRKALMTAFNDPVSVKRTVLDVAEK